MGLFDKVVPYVFLYKTCELLTLVHPFPKKIQTNLQNFREFSVITIFFAKCSVARQMLHEMGQTIAQNDHKTILFMVNKTICHQFVYIGNAGTAMATKKVCATTVYPPPKIDFFGIM